MYHQTIIWPEFKYNLPLWNWFPVQPAIVGESERTACFHPTMWLPRGDRCGPAVVFRVSYNSQDAHFGISYRLSPTRRWNSLSLSHIKHSIDQNLRLIRRWNQAVEYRPMRIWTYCWMRELITTDKGRRDNPNTNLVKAEKAQVGIQAVGLGSYLNTSSKETRVRKHIQKPQGPQYSTSQLQNARNISQTLQSKQCLLKYSR